MYHDPEHPLFQIDWIDAQGGGGWSSKEYLKDKAGVTPCHSVGFYLCEDETSVTLVMSLDPGNGNGSEPLSIPKVCIVEQTRLGAARKKAPVKDKPQVPA